MLAIQAARRLLTVVAIFRSVGGRKGATQRFNDESQSARLRNVDLTFCFTFPAKQSMGVLFFWFIRQVRT